MHGEGNGTPLQYSCLENPMDGGAWKAAVHGVIEGRTRLSDFTFTFHFHALEKEMATHSGVLAWRIPGTGEPDGLPSMGSHRVGHDWSDLAAWYSLIINMCFFMAISIWFGKYLEENQTWKSMAWKLSTLPWNYSDQEEPYLPLLLSFHSITLNGRANLYHLRML